MYRRSTYVPIVNNKHGRQSIDVYNMIYESIIIPQSEMTDHISDIFYLTYHIP